MTTEAPADLLAFRTAVMDACGFVDPVEVGIKGDVAHAIRGGYHISGNDIAATGRFNEDFSTKRARDHFLPNSNASAVDIGDNWPNGGRAAWLRFNNLVLFDLVNHPAELTTVRAINCSTDGSNRKRYDRANASDGVINSTDTVTIHTHLEWWRDTVGHRSADLARLLQHVNTAIYGVTPPATPIEGEIMFLRTSNGSIYLNAGTGLVSLTPAEWAAVSPQSYVNVPQSVADKANALATPGNPASQADVVAALQSPEGQAAIVTAVNTAEDS
jgi:hypothetical protein